MTFLPEFETNPPLYSACFPVPDYTRLPSSGEQRLDAASSTRRLPKGTVVKKDGHITIILEDQNDKAEIPTFGRGAAIRGSIIMDGLVSLSEVSVKVTGKLEATSTEIGVIFHDLVADTYKVWSSDDPDNTLVQSPAGLIPFSIRLRTTYEYNGETYPIPPTFQASVAGVPGLYVNTSYFLTFSVTGIKRRQIGYWNKTRRFNVPFKYYPRTQPSGPIHHARDFFSAIKLDPDGWHQSVGVIKATGDVSPIELHFFLPSERVFGVEDVIPFHVQFIGSIHALRELFAPPEVDPPTKSSSNSYWNPFHMQGSTGKMNKSPVPPDKESTTPVLRVSIIRQICIELEGSRAWKNVTLGEGHVFPLPPPLNWLESDLKVKPEEFMIEPSTSGCSGFALDREESLDWGGEIRICPDSPPNPDEGPAESCEVGSFTAGGVLVKDFVVVSLMPPTSCTFSKLRHAIPIRLVSDTYIDLPPER